MEYQGTPIGGSHDGTKVKSNEVRREDAGPVASDSLAAESYRDGGGFAENRGGVPSSVPGGSSTWTNTDTTNATRLNPARDREARDSDEPQRVPGGSGASYNTGSGGNTDYTSSAGVAPNYTLAQEGAFVDGKPKGRNLTEGGFTGEATNYTSNIGGKNDPGRAALREFQREDARVDPGNKTDYGKVDNDDAYKALDRNASA